MSASRCWASWPCLRTRVARRMARKRSSGSVDPSGRSRQKNESRLPGSANFIAGRDRKAVQTHRHLHADCAEVAVTGLEPAPQPTCHHGQDCVIDRGTVGGAGHAAQALQLAAAKATARRASMCPSKGDRSHGCGASRAAASRPPSRWCAADRPAPASRGRGSGPIGPSISVRPLVPQRCVGHAHGSRAICERVVDAPDQGTTASG